MIPILLFILQSLSSVLCLNCSDVRQSNGFGIYVKRETKGDRINWIYDKNGKEWKLNLTEKNREMDIESIGNETLEYALRAMIRFSNYIRFEHLKQTVSYNCHIRMDRNLSGQPIGIICGVSVNRAKPYAVGVRLKTNNPLAFKTYPKNNDYSSPQVMVYNRHNKSDRVILEMLSIDHRKANYSLRITKDNLPDIPFIRGMNDSLFGQIDSIIDYNLDHTKGLSGHMLWFNIKDRHYYCFQPEEQPLSEQVFIYELIKIKFD